MSKEKRVVIVVQARTTSTRLPEKIMLPLIGQPLLVRMMERVKHSNLCDEAVVATSTQKEDDAIEELCRKEKISFFRGHLNDLLDRHYKAGVIYNADVVVKIPSDCPLIDPKIIDRVIGFFTDNPDKYDYVSNLHPPSYPDGNDVEVMTIKALEKAWKEAKRGLEREHTTPYIWENPAAFRIGNVYWEKNLDYSTSHRWTIDYYEDYEFISSVYNELYCKNPLFGIDDILKLLEDKPEIKKINEKYLGLYWYEHHLDELANIREYKEKRKNNKTESQI